jgi:hypothetical protein
MVPLGVVMVPLLLTQIPVNYLKSTWWIIFRGGNGTTGGGNGSAAHKINSLKNFGYFMTIFLLEW